MVEPLAYLNGRYMPLADAAIPLLDPGFTSGATVFDNCRTWHGHLFRWPDYIRRFQDDCRACHIPMPMDLPELTAIAERLLDGVAEDMHVIPFATPGTIGLYTRPIDMARNRRLADQGGILRIVGHQPVDDTAVLSPRWKHRSRIVLHIAEHLAAGAIPLFLDRPDGTLTETSYANVLAVIDGVLVTPPRRLILDGISLRVTLELADAHDIPWREGEIRCTDWQNASEMLLTGTGFGIASVSRIDDVTIPWPGPVFKTLKDAWTAVTSGNASARHH